jgi:saccharopine dehydrogenase (NAD+, L-lysine-forming)
MKVMLLGVGAIGTVIARHLAGHRAIEKLTLSDMDTTRAERLARQIGDGRTDVVRLDAADREALARGLQGYGLVINAVLPRFNVAIMEAALAAGSHYMDLAGGEEDQFAHDSRWKKAGRVALHGMGEDPGISNVFARCAADALDEVEAIRVRDGEYSTGGFPFACLFSTETFVEEAVSEATYFEDGRWKKLPAWSNREVYPFPKPVGPQPIYNMSHEEVHTLPRFIGKGVRFVDFKLAVPDEMQRHLAFLHSIGMTRLDKVKVRGGEVTPMSVLAAVLPQPADLGGKIKGAAIVLVEVEGRRNGKRVRHVLHAAMTHAEANRRQGVTATAFLTGTGAAVGALAIATGKVKARGVIPPELLDPEPVIELLEGLGVKVHRQVKTLGAGRPAKARPAALKTAGRRDSRARARML